MLLSIILIAVIALGVIYLFSTSTEDDVNERMDRLLSGSGERSNQGSTSKLDHELDEDLYDRSRDDSEAESTLFTDASEDYGTQSGSFDPLSQEVYYSDGDVLG